MQIKGQGVASIKTAVRGARRRAGLDESVVAYTLRHTSITTML